MQIWHHCIMTTLLCTDWTMVLMCHTVCRAGIEGSEAAILPVIAGTTVVCSGMATCFLAS